MRRFVVTAVLLGSAIVLVWGLPRPCAVVRAESPPAAGLGSPETWVRASVTHPVFWWIWAEVRDYLGEDPWRAIDTSWMPVRARADLGEVVGTGWRYVDPYLLGGLWRLGLEREEVLRILSNREPEPHWPLSARDRRFLSLWQPRLERWYRAQPADEAAKNLRVKLEETWREAATSKNLDLAAQVVEASAARLGPEAADALAADARRLLREALLEWEAQRRADPRKTVPMPVPVALMERFGVPDGLDLEAGIGAARQREEALRDETIPLPHPYDKRLDVLRLQRLRDRHE